MASGSNDKNFTGGRGKKTRANAVKAAKKSRKTNPGRWMGGGEEGFGPGWTTVKGRGKYAEKRRRR